VKRELLALFVLLPFFAGCLSFHKGPMPGEPTAARYADVDGIRVRYTDTGEPGAPATAAPAAAAGEPNAAPAASTTKPTVVLVHGFASSLGVWAGVAPVLAHTHRVIALDLKGFG